MKTIILILWVAAALAALQGTVHGEVIYLNDGQIIKGSIVSEDTETITVKSRYQTRKIYRGHVMRILYGDLDMEQVHLLLKDGSLLKGFLVDQDATRIVYRESRESAEERSIPKENIRQMSREEIPLLNPDISFTTGFFAPLNGGGPHFKSAPVYVAGSAMNLFFTNRARLLFEAGYTRSESSSHTGSEFQFVPLTAGIQIPLSLKYADLAARIGIGGAYIKFDTGEGERFQGIVMASVAGMGISTGIMGKRLKGLLWFDFTLLSEGGALLPGAVIRGGLSYLF